MINLAELKARTRKPLCSVQWIIPYDGGEGFSVADDGAIVEGDSYQLVLANLMPLSSDGLLVWQSTVESIAASLIGSMGPEGTTISELLSKASALADDMESAKDSGGEDSEEYLALKIQSDALDKDLGPHRLALVTATTATASDVRDVQAKALERVLGMPAGSAKLVRTIDLGEDLFKQAWEAVSEALAPKPAEGKGKKKAKGKALAKTEEF